MIESRSRGVLDAPLEPVIGLAEGETRWRGMTTYCGTARLNQIGFPAYGIDAVRPPSTGMAWPLT
jgi:hypothetical protein